MITSVEAGSKHAFIKVKTTPLSGIDTDGQLVDNPGDYVYRLATGLKKDVITPSDKYSIFIWHSPTEDIPYEEYPLRLRSFTPIPFSEEEHHIATKIIQENGPFVSHRRDFYTEGQWDSILARERTDVVYFEVPDHQARGFRDTGIFEFQTPHGNRIKFSVCTKGNGTCGYWQARRKTEMLDALDGKLESYPLNPDQFHARDHKNQSRGQKSGDDIVWVGCASDQVTRREVRGFGLYEECQIFHPICLPVREFEELPLATGEFIPAESFTRLFDPETKLVYLAKAWALETRIWGNHFSHRNLTAAHILSAREGNNESEWVFQKILHDLHISAPMRREKLRMENDNVLLTLSLVDPNDWDKIIGFASNILRQKGVIEASGGQIIPIILSANMIENAARAGAHRMWGKPVAWHLENIGRLGEVSGGERIFGLASGQPDAMEYHSLFSYLFDAYMAVSIEWATAGLTYMPFEGFFNIIRNRILQLNHDHWINQYPTLDQFIAFCQTQRPDYVVSYRGEDTYPLMAVEGTTDPTMVFDNNYGIWKNWPDLQRNGEQFLQGIRLAYQS